MHDALIEKGSGSFSQETSALMQGMGADGGVERGGRKEGRPKCVKMKIALTSVLPLSDCNSSCTLCKSAFAWTQKQGMCGVHTVKAAKSYIL